MKAPGHFTQDFYTPAQLDTAFEEWADQHGQLGAWFRSHMWHRSLAVSPVEAEAHQCYIYSADLRPPLIQYGDSGPKSAHGPGELLYQAICPPCQWHSIHADENAAVEAWHDHAFPGWEKLPLLPEDIALSDGMKIRKTARDWIKDHYPTAAQVPGAPVRTQRPPHQRRHVPGRSPWGGYDLGTIIEPPPTLF